MNKFFTYLKYAPGDERLPNLLHYQIIVKCFNDTICYIGAFSVVCKKECVLLYYCKSDKILGQTTQCRILTNKYTYSL